MPKRAIKQVKRSSKKVAKKAIKRKSKGLLSGMDELPELLKPEEAQNVLRVSRATMFRTIEAGTLPGAVRVHGSWRILRDKLRDYLIESAT